MEHIFAYRRLPTATAITIRLPWYLWLVLYLQIGITIVVFWVILAAHREPSDPFSAFSDWSDDDARQTALARGFTCRDIPLRTHHHESCVQNMTGGVFSAIYLRLSGNAMSEIGFRLEQNTLTLGDLVLLWGAPEIRLYCETVVVLWPGRDAVGLATHSQTARIRYNMPVLFVTFTRGGLSDWEKFLIDTTELQCGSVRVGSLAP